MKVIKNITLCFVFISVISCNPAEKKRNFICFLDLSGSITEETFNEYTEVLVHDVYENLTGNDQIRIYPLDYASRIKNDPIFFEDLSTLDFSENVKTVSHRESEMKKIIKNHTSTLKDSLITIILNSKKQRKSYSFKTDILGALQKVYREKLENKDKGGWEGFNGYMTGEKQFVVENYIIIFSDMIHEEGSLNFNALNTTQKADELMVNLGKNKQIPEMSEFKVYVNGITARNNTSLDAIEHFWQGYFELSKAELVCLNYNCGNNLNRDL